MIDREFVVTLHSLNAEQIAVLQRVEIAPDGCWLWTHGTDSSGYGTFRPGRLDLGAHRYAYQAWHGPVPASWEVDHLCRVRRCVNPDHLEATTRFENIRRDHEARRIGVYRTACGNGHPVTTQNSYVSPSGKWSCRLCNAAAVARYKAKRAA